MTTKYKNRQSECPYGVMHDKIDYCRLGRITWPSCSCMSPIIAKGVKGLKCPYWWPSMPYRQYHDLVMSGELNRLSMKDAEDVAKSTNNPSNG